MAVFRGAIGYVNQMQGQLYPNVNLLDGQMLDQEDLGVRNTDYILQDDQQADIVKGFDLKVMSSSSM